MQLESQYMIEPGEYGQAELCVYPEKQIHMDGHPEIAQMLKVTHWGHGTAMLTIRHPLGQTNLKVRVEDLLAGLNDFFGEQK